MFQGEGLDDIYAGLVCFIFNCFNSKVVLIVSYNFFLVKLKRKFPKVKVNSIIFIAHGNKCMYKFLLLHNVHSTHQYVSTVPSVHYTHK